MPQAGEAAERLAVGEEITPAKGQTPKRGESCQRAVTS